MYTKGQPNKECILCVANYPSNIGYAWSFIDQIYEGVASRLAKNGIMTIVAYPKIYNGQCTCNNSLLRKIELDINMNSLQSVQRLLIAIVKNKIRVIYLSDRAIFHPTYLLLRLFGVRKIVVHDHSSGTRNTPTGFKYIMKWTLMRIPGLQADTVIGVSDFVVRRIIDVALVPRKRVKRIWNFVVPIDLTYKCRNILREEFGISSGAALIICACRATEEKGIENLLRAFELLNSRIEYYGINEKPKLIYMGDGPNIERLKNIKNGLSWREHIIFAGYRSNAIQLLSEADICVVPSIWEEAFCLSALEPMVMGIPIIATRVGGIPEIVLDGETGMLVEPGDVDKLAEAMSILILRPDMRIKMGEKGRQRAEKLFSPKDKLDAITSILGAGFSQAIRSKLNIKNSN